MGKLFKKLLIIALIPILICAFNFIIDPLQFYRRAMFYTPEFVDRERYQIPGIVKNYSYDTVLIGGTIAENFSLKELRDQYGINAVKLAQSSSTAYEQRLAVEAAIRTNKVKRVIWVIDYPSLSGGATETRADYPRYLYDLNPFNDIRYLLSTDTTRKSIDILRYWTLYNAEKTFDNQEKLNSWWQWSVFGKAETAEAFEADMRDGAFLPSSDLNAKYETSKLHENIDDNIMEPALRNPGIEFIYILPPVSILEHVSYDTRGIFEREIELRQYIFDRYAGAYNIRLYDFQADRWIVLDLERYKDKESPDNAVNSRILEAIMTEHPVTNEQFELNQEDLHSWVKGFDFYQFIEEKH